MKRKKILIVIIIITIMIVVLAILANRSVSFKSICVTQDKWNNLISIKNRLEGSNIVKIDNIRFNDYDLIVDDKNNKIYYSLVNVDKEKFNPKITYKISDPSYKLAILGSSIDDNTIHNNYTYKVLMYNSIAYRVYDLYCTEFPVLNINYKDNSNYLKNIPIDIYLFDNLGFSPNRIIRSNGKLDLLGNDTYAFELFIMSPGRNERENRISIFNMNPHDKYLLTPINNIKEANSLPNKEEKGDFDKNHYIELFINSEYQGLYLLSSNTKSKDLKPNNNFSNSGEQ